MDRIEDGSGEECGIVNKHQYEIRLMHDQNIFLRFSVRSSHRLPERVCPQVVVKQKLTPVRINYQKTCKCDNILVEKILRGDLWRVKYKPTSSRIVNVQ